MRPTKDIGRLLLATETNDQFVVVDTESDMPVKQVTETAEHPLLFDTFPRQGDDIDVLLKFEDNLKPNSVETCQLLQESEEFVKDVLRYSAEQPESRLRLSIVASTMYDYGYQLERLNRLVEHYHKSDDDEALWLSWLKK